ncbi:MAG: hypothetical protein INR62_09575 [Rhodospirillales bacterium]|nr:hypothetical protein [Acetobacter sp.]
MPAPEGGDDLVGILGSAGGTRAGVGFLEKAVDGGLEVDEGMECPMFQPPLGQFGKKPSTILSHGAKVRMKWKVQRGCWFNTA